MAGRKVQGSGHGLQDDLSRSASTQRLTMILGVGAFYTLSMAGNCTRGVWCHYGWHLVVVSTGFGRKLGGGRPVVSWIFQEMTLHGGCEMGIGGRDDDPTLVERRVLAHPQGRPWHMYTSPLYCTTNWTLCVTHGCLIILLSQICEISFFASF